MPNYAGLAAKKSELIRKSLSMSLFLTEDTTSASLIPNLTDSTNGALLALPTGGGYVDAGWFTPEGLRFNRTIAQDEVQSAGSNTPTRTDITSDTETVQVDFQETNRVTIALDTGAARTGLTLKTGSKELQIDKPTVAVPRRYRALALSVDGPPEAEIYLGRWYPRLSVNDRAGSAYAQNAVNQVGVTFGAEPDSAVGTALRYFFGGPGWILLLDKMGFPTT